MSAPKLFWNLGEILTGWRTADPDAVAVITDGRADDPTAAPRRDIHRVADLADLVDAQAQAVIAWTPRGARVGVNAANSLEVVALLYAVPGADRTLVPLNTRLTDHAKAEQLERAGVRLLIGDAVDGFTGTTVPLGEFGTGDRPRAEAPRFLDQVNSTRTLATGTRPTSQTATEGPPDAPDAPRVAAAQRHGDGDAWIIFTSGSTGRPKGVRVSDASVASAVAATALARPLADDDVYLYPFPLFHVAAYNVVHAHARRRPVVLPERFDARRIIELCHLHEVTSMSVAATMLRMLLDALAGDPTLTPPPKLRTIAYGAAPMPEDLLREAHDVLGCDFAQGYGSTELSGNAIFLSPADHRRGLAGERRFLQAAGYAGPGVAVRVVDEAGRDVPAGRPGELLVAADQVCAGYLDDPEATATAIDGGWLHTGDVATVDDDGLVHIVDRAKDIVVTGGENVSSRQVEDVLRSHPFVADVAVIGTPDPQWGEAVTAIIVLDSAGPHSSVADGVGVGVGVVQAPDAVADELRRHVGDRLAGFAKPRRVFVVATLPHNANGKVDKPALRAAVAARLDG